MCVKDVQINFLLLASSILKIMLGSESADPFVISKYWQLRKHAMK